MKTTELDDRTLFQSLQRTVCISCGQVKKPHQTMCLGCYRQLPKWMQLALYKGLGRGYQEAVQAALKRLGVAEPKLPEARAV